MTFDDVLASLTPLLRGAESASIVDSDDVGDQMIAVTGGARTANIYDYGDLFVWYAQPGGGAWPADSAAAMADQLSLFVDYMRASPAAGDLLTAEANSMTPSDLVASLPDLFAGGSGRWEGTELNGTQFLEFQYPSGTLRIEKAGDQLSVHAVTCYRRWRASKRDLTEAREAVQNVLNTINTTN